MRISAVSVILFLPMLALGQDAISKKKQSIEYFEQAAKVFQHPRCLNCHPAGDAPTQGPSLKAHAMNVQRGPDDHGALGLKCAACHGQENNVHSGVPGAPKWGLAPRSMSWAGLKTGDLCRAIKDPQKNHGMTLEKLVEHNARDPLVGWAWNPGKGRGPAPGAQKEFGELVAKWVSTGAECPD